MVLIDYIAIGVVLVSLLFGLLFGFGKLLKFFTGGIFGIIISIVVTYFFIGVVSSWSFVQKLMVMLIEAMQSKESVFLNFLLKIGIEKIILAVGLFIVVQLIRLIIVLIIKGIVEIDRPFMKVINRIFGIVFMLAVSCMLFLLVFHIIHLVEGDEFLIKLQGSVFKLDWVYDHNPLKYIVQRAGS